MLTPFIVLTLRRVIIASGLRLMSVLPFLICCHKTVILLRPRFKRIAILVLIGLIPLLFLVFVIVPVNGISDFIGTRILFEAVTRQRRNRGVVGPIYHLSLTWFRRWWNVVITLLQMILRWGRVTVRRCQTRPRTARGRLLKFSNFQKLPFQKCFLVSLTKRRLESLLVR